MTMKDLGVLGLGVLLLLVGLMVLGNIRPGPMQPIRWPVITGSVPNIMP
jgi:hypothetical protein